MPAVALRWHEAASTRSPSTSTMQARQLPSARYPGAGCQHRCGILVPCRCATCQIVSSGAASTGLPSSSRIMRVALVMAAMPSRARFALRAKLPAAAGTPACRCGCLPWSRALALQFDLDESILEAIGVDDIVMHTGLARIGDALRQLGKARLAVRGDDL